MLRTVTAASLLLALGACQYDKEGVYVAYIPVADDPTCTTTISENITDADPPEDVTTTTDWVFDSTGTVSDAVVFVQIFESKDGNVVFQIADSVYTGTSDGGVITVEWVNQNQTTDTVSNGNAGYNYTETNDSTITNTITMQKNKETKGYTATWKTSSNVSINATETDEWDAEAGYYYYTTGQINTWIFSYLVGGASNNYDMVDCDSDPCMVNIVSNCEGSFNFEMVETDLDSEDYTGVQDAGQPNGVGF